jgi:transposase
MLDHSESYQASRTTRSTPVPALPPYLIEPIWQQFAALLPGREIEHPLGCHRLRIPDRVVFDKLVQILVFGCAYRRIADDSCSATTLRDRRDEWIACGAIEKLRTIALKAYDRFIGLELGDIAVDGCIAKAPCGGEKAGKSPVDRGKQGTKRSTAVDANGIPIGDVSTPANRNDSPLLVPTLQHASASVGGLPDLANVHLDRGYDSSVTRERLEGLNLIGEVSKKGRPAPLQAGQRWVVERTNSWHNAHKKLAWCTERVGKVIDFWVAFSDVVIIVRRLVREGWSRYRWEGRPTRRP